MDWQPIENAPTRTRLLLWAPDLNRQFGRAGEAVFGRVMEDGKRGITIDGLYGEDHRVTHFAFPDGPDAVSTFAMSGTT